MTPIDQDALLDALDVKREEIIADANHNYLRGYMDAVDVVRHAEPVQPEPKKGYWIQIGDGYIDYVKCNLCERMRCYPELYCPNCGAKMERWIG